MKTAGIVCLALAFAGTHSALAAGFEKLSRTAEEVLTACTNTRCKVTSLPGEPGYDLVASRSAPLIYNDVEIGTLYEKVWRHQSQPKLHIFGMRVVMNANAYDSTGAAFNVNDLFRQTRPRSGVSAAYFLDGATKGLQAAGRTVQGFNEFEEEQPERDNTWVDFRIDANAAEPEGPSSAKSPWLLTKTRAPEGFALNPLGARVLNSDVADLLDAVDFYAASYQPNGVPPPEDEEEEEDVTE